MEANIFFKVCSALRTYLVLRLECCSFCLCVVFSLEKVGSLFLSSPFAKKKEADFQWRFCFLFIQLITPSRWMYWSSWRCWTCGTPGWSSCKSSLSFFLHFLPALPLASLRNRLCILTANHYPLWAFILLPYFSSLLDVNYFMMCCVWRLFNFKVIWYLFFIPVD